MVVNSKSSGSIVTTLLYTSRTETRTVVMSGVEKLNVDQRAMWKLIFLEKRTQALVSASADGMLRFWNVKEGTLVWEHDAEHKNKDNWCGHIKGSRSSC